MRLRYLPNSNYKNGTSDLSATRQQELAETGGLKNMDFNHLPTVNSGKDIKEKVDLAKNPGPNSGFMEPPDHRAFHSEKGGTRVPLDENGDIIGSLMIGAAVVLETLSAIPSPDMLLEPIEVGCGTRDCYDSDGEYTGLANE